MLLEEIIVPYSKYKNFIMIENLDITDCLSILGSNHIGRLGYVFGQSPFILPITYYHDPEEKCIISYSSEGHKIDAMRRYDIVALQVDEIKGIHDWKSVMVQGRYDELASSDAKLYLRRFADGVNKIISKNNQQTPQFIKEFSNKLDQKGLPIVYRIVISDIFGKYRTT